MNEAPFEELLILLQLPVFHALPRLLKGMYGGTTLAGRLLRKAKDKIRHDGYIRVDQCCYVMCNEHTCWVEGIFCKWHLFSQHGTTNPKDLFYIQLNSVSLCTVASTPN